MKETSKTISFVQTSLSLKNNNLSQDNSYICDTFLETIADYFVHQVTTNNKIIEAIKNHNIMTETELNALINQIIIEMECGLVPEQDEELYENMLIILTTAIKDYPKKIVRKKAMCNNFVCHKFDKSKKNCYN